MDRQWEKRPRPLSPPRLAREHASFSAALLDAIYRSIDTSPDKRTGSKNSSPDISRVPPAEFWRDPRAASADPNSQMAPQKYPSTPRYLTSSTSSTPRRRPPRKNRVLPDPCPPSLPNIPRIEEDVVESGPKSDKKKGKKKRSIMHFLKSFFSIKRDKKTKQRPAQPPQLMAASADTVDHPIGSSARSCMSSRRKSEGPKRSVRFAPVSVIVDEECKPCGHKRVYDGAVERRVEELIKVLKVEERGRKKGSSGSGSEMSELDSLVTAA
ncbi:SKI/DACH domain protein [Rhynchospora pubera]|uniref:SKI/DACH domain protein n=1 Tax=Rhynchospora pubera TaxID=906938 RepID=A0AAV8CFI3_9POAL|nr:SKI/DACH domain protein [Rhynchospora pubera]